MTDLELGWLTGIVEGEGCFILSKYKVKSGQSHAALYLRVTSTDLDILERLVNLTSSGIITGPIQPYVQHGQRTPWFRWDVYKKKEVARLLLAIYPALGDRRRRRLAEALTAAWPIYKA